MHPFINLDTIKRQVLCSINNADINTKLICLFQRGHKSNGIDKITFT